MELNKKKWDKNKKDESMFVGQQQNISTQKKNMGR
jgi:hypothetical protein